MRSKYISYFIQLRVVQLYSIFISRILLIPWRAAARISVMSLENHRGRSCFFTSARVSPEYAFLVLINSFK